MICIFDITSACLHNTEPNKSHRRSKQKYSLSIPAFYCNRSKVVAISVSTMAALMMTMPLLSLSADIVPVHDRRRKRRRRRRILVLLPTATMLSCCCLFLFLLALSCLLNHIVVVVEASSSSSSNNNNNGNDIIRHQPHRRDYRSSRFIRPSPSVSTMLPPPTTSELKRVNNIKNNSKAWTKTKGMSIFGFGTIVIGVAISKNNFNINILKNNYNAENEIEGSGSNYINASPNNNKSSDGSTISRDSTTDDRTVLIETMQKLLTIIIGTILTIPVSVIICIVCIYIIPTILYFWGRNVLLEAWKQLPLPISILLITIGIISILLYLDYFNIVLEQSLSSRNIITDHKVVVFVLLMEIFGLLYRNWWKNE